MARFRIEIHTQHTHNGAKSHKYRFHYQRIHFMVIGQSAPKSWWALEKELKPTQQFWGTGESYIVCESSARHG